MSEPKSGASIDNDVYLDSGSVYLQAVNGDLKEPLGEEEWNRRYLQDFPHDNIVLRGTGFSRYSRRYNARLASSNILSRQTPYRWNTKDEDGGKQIFQRAVSYFKMVPITDFATFDISGEIEVDTTDTYATRAHWDDARLFELGMRGLVVRGLNGKLFLSSLDGVDALADASQVSQLRICPDGEMIRGVQDGKTLEFDMRFHLHTRKYTGFQKPELDPTYTSDGLDHDTDDFTGNFSSSTLKQAYRDSEVFHASGSKDRDYSGGHFRSAQTSHLLKALMDTVPGEPDTFFYHGSYLAAASVGNILMPCVAKGTHRGFL